ncbi:TPR-domain containing protein, partial [hydrothermal vent metagenome]
MKGKILYLIAISIFFIEFCSAQKATITEKKMEMKTYMFSDPNPVPDMGKNYPYFEFNGYTNKSTQQEWNMVILENDYIIVYVNTDVGGKIWGAIEKSTGREFLYYNDVVKFRDIARRGPWTSGGLEFNYGVKGHTSTASTPQDYIIKENKDGSVSCVIGAIDLHTRTKWNVEINLQKDKAYIEIIGSWFNTGNLPQSFYHFSNAAAKTEGGLEYIFPGPHYIGHNGEVGDWPVEKDRDISFYENNDFGGNKSYHVINGFANFMGGYWHNDDFGFGNIHNYAEMPGKKIWLWGLADQGMIWENLLTDSNGQYTEFQTGGTFNQPNANSSLTPFKHREFAPHDTDLSTELYFPLKKTGGMVMATKFGVLNIIRKTDDIIEIRLSALAPLQTKLFIKSENRLLSMTEIKLQPLDLSIIEVELEVGKEFTVELGDDLLFYSSKKDYIIVDRPVLSNKAFDWDSAV